MQDNKNNAQPLEGDVEKEESFEEQLFDVISSKIGDQDEPPKYLRQCADLAINMPLGPEELRARCFHLIGGTVIFGLCIAELPDSYLAATPSVLTSSNGDVEGKGIGASEVIRLKKSGISFVSLPTDEHKYYYYRWLKRRHKYECDIFTQERREIIDKFLYTYENRNSTSKSSQDKNTSVDKEVQAKSGANSDSFWIPSDGKMRH